MGTPRRILIHGASGRMGRALLRLCATDANCHVVAAVSRKPAQRVIEGIPQFGSAELRGSPAFDVAIDFSLAEAFDPILALCVARGAALVSGTTGLDTAQLAALDAAAQRIPLVWAANFSLGVAVLTDLVTRAARALPGWQCDILEQHHAHKQDAPSGTALALGEAAGQARYNAIRAGDIVGEHTVQFTTAGERLELTHRAGDRDIFAAGALHAATRLVGRAPGRYQLRELLD